MAQRLSHRCGGGRRALLRTIHGDIEGCFLAMVAIAILMLTGVFYFQKLWVFVIAAAALVVLLSYLAWFENRRLED